MNLRLKCIVPVSSLSPKGFLASTQIWSKSMKRKMKELENLVNVINTGTRL